MNKFKIHELDDCFLVWYGRWLSREDALEEEICEQGYADFHFGGINCREAKKAKKRYEI